MAYGIVLTVIGVTGRVFLHNSWADMRGQPSRRRDLAERVNLIFFRKTASMGVDVATWFSKRNAGSWTVPSVQATRIQLAGGPLIRSNPAEREACCQLLLPPLLPVLRSGPVRLRRRRIAKPAAI